MYEYGGSESDKNMDRNTVYDPLNSHFYICKKKTISISSF